MRCPSASPTRPRGGRDKSFGSGGVVLCVCVCVRDSATGLLFASFAHVRMAGSVALDTLSVETLTSWL